MLAIEATNRGDASDAWAMLTEDADIPEMEVDALAADTSGALRLDVREPEEFARGHVPGALPLPQAELATRLGELPRDRPIHLICQSGSRSYRSAQFLRQVGFTDVASVAGGTTAWHRAGQPLER
jgi:thioredoxin 1